MLKLLTVWITKKCGKFLEIGVQGHLTCLLRNLYTGQEETVRTRHGTTDWLKIGERVQQGCILSLGLFNLHVKFIMQNVSLDESQAGIKLSRRNINNLRYADDTTLMAESGEEQKSLLMGVKEESEKAALKFNIKKKKKTKIVASVPSLYGKKGEKECSDIFYFLGLQNHCRFVITAMKLRDTCSLEGKL